jgi:acetaldehyde dehydrogenase
VFCPVPADADRGAITASAEKRVAEVQGYVPGYTRRSSIRAR